MFSLRGRTTCKYDHFSSLTIFAFQIEQQLKNHFSDLGPDPTPCIGRLYTVNMTKRFIRIVQGVHRLQRCEISEVAIK